MVWQALTDKVPALESALRKLLAQ
ncbi:MAG: hypothetical protein ACRDTN_09825 [Mycobacterium sp.]